VISRTVESDRELGPAQGLVEGAHAVRRASDTESDELRVWLEPRIPTILGRPASISHIERQPCRYASSYGADIVTVHLDTGSQFRLFLKDFGCSRFPKTDPARRRERERQVYEVILQGTALGTPQCYGSIWDDARGRFWLLLEFVDGPELRATTFENWIMAAAWLGRLHGRFSQDVDSLSALDFLVHHDADFFAAPAELALREVSQISATLARRLATVLNGHDALVAVMASQPKTLVHGHFRPCNIVVDAAADPIRVCPVDWEQVAVGSGFYDLAFLVDGFEPLRLNSLIEAYRQAALDHHVAVPDAEEINYIVRCFRLFNAIALLSRAGARGLSEAKVARTVTLIESLYQLAAPDKRRN
jgi:aminoglycoside phosphotransferase (APT) family kinase protein